MNSFCQPAAKPFCICLDYSPCSFLALCQDGEGSVCVSVCVWVIACIRALFGPYSSMYVTFVIM